MTTQPWSETERAFQKILLVNFIQNLRHRRLNRTINHRRNPDWTLSSIRLRDIHPANWRWRVTPLVDLLQNRRQKPTQILAGLPDAHSVHPRRSTVITRFIAHTLWSEFPVLA